MNEKTKNTIIIILLVIVVLLDIFIALLLTGVLDINSSGIEINKNNKTSAVENKEETTKEEDTWTDILLSYDIKEIKLHRMRSIDLGDTEDLDKEITLTKENLEEILTTLSSSALTKEYSLGLGGTESDRLTINYTYNNTDYTFALLNGIIYVDNLNEELISYLEKVKSSEINTEYKEEEGSFYIYRVDNYSKEMYDKYFS